MLQPHSDPRLWDGPTSREAQPAWLKNIQAERELAGSKKENPKKKNPECSTQLVPPIDIAIHRVCVYAALLRLQHTRPVAAGGQRLS